MPEVYWAVDSAIETPGTGPGRAFLSRCGKPRSVPRIPVQSTAGPHYFFLAAFFLAAFFAVFFLAAFFLATRSPP